MRNARRTLFGKMAKLGFISVNAMMALWFVMAVVNGWLTGPKALHMGAGWLFLALFFGSLTLLTRPPRT